MSLTLQYYWAPMEFSLKVGESKKLSIAIGNANGKLFRVFVVTKYAVGPKKNRYYIYSDPKVEQLSTK